MLLVIDKGADGGIDISANGQIVLNIGDVSDDETINLFFTPVGSDAVIVETKPCTGENMPWSHELLVSRCKS